MASPLTVVRYTKSPRAANKGYFAIDVDASDVATLIHRANMAVSEASLYAFVAGGVKLYFQDQIIQRFADNGDPASGRWLPLEESTRAIRQAMGVLDDWAINERTGDFINWITYSSRVIPVPDGAMLTLPGADGDSDLERKLRTAQLGATQGSGDMIPGAYTPPRPVLAFDSTDLAALMWMLQIHIMQFMGGNFFMGAPPP